MTRDSKTSLPATKVQLSFVSLSFSKKSAEFRSQIFTFLLHPFTGELVRRSSLQQYLSVRVTLWSWDETSFDVPMYRLYSLDYWNKVIYSNAAICHRLHWLLHSIPRKSTWNQTLVVFTIHYRRSSIRELPWLKMRLLNDWVLISYMMLVPKAFRSASIGKARCTSCREMKSWKNLFVSIVDLKYNLKETAGYSNHQYRDRPSKTEARKRDGHRST